MIFDFGAEVCVWLQHVFVRMEWNWGKQKCSTTYYVILPSVETDEQGMYKNYNARSSIVTSIIDPLDKIDLKDNIGHDINMAHKECCIDKQMTMTIFKLHREDE